MRIAMVSQPTDHVPPTGGGSIAIWADALSSRLSDHDVTIYCRKTPDRLGDDAKGKVRHARVSARFDDAVVRGFQIVEPRIERIFGWRPQLYYRWYYFGAAYYRQYARAIARRIKQDGADVIIVTNYSQFVPVLKRENPNSKIVLMMQCDWLIELDPSTVRRRLPGVDAVMGCSNYIARGVAERFPEYADRCHTLYNATNPDLFGPSPETQKHVDRLRGELDLQGRRVLVYTGRLVPEKGIHVLLEAMREVVDSAPDAVLLMLGSFCGQPPSPSWLLRRDEEQRTFEEMRDGYEEQMRAAASDLGDRVRFLGGVPHYDLPAYYALADVFVHPAVWNEPFGMVLTEAMASGLPVVSTRAGGIPEIVVDGETGRLVSPGEVGGLAEALVELVRDEALRKEMGKRGRQRLMDCFSWDHTARALERVIEGLQ